MNKGKWEGNRIWINLSLSEGLIEEILNHPEKNGMNIYQFIYSAIQEKLESSNGKARK